MLIEDQKNNMESEVYLIGIRLSNNIAPELYTLVVCGNKDTPLFSDGKFIFFSSTDFVNVAFEMLDEKIKQKSTHPKELSLVVDIPLTLKLLRKNKLDKEATVLNCLNTLFDFLDFSKSDLSNNFKQILFGLTDHLTFHANFDDYLKEKQISRQEIVDAILWCIGSIFVRAKLL